MDTSSLLADLKLFITAALLFSISKCMIIHLLLIISLVVLTDMGTINDYIWICLNLVSQLAVVISLVFLC